MVLIGGFLYEVGDPVHPRLLCTMAGTVAHLYTGDTFAYLKDNNGTTDVRLHSMGSGNESVVAGFPAPMALLQGPFSNTGAWTVDGNNAATAVATTDASGKPVIQIWLFSQPNTDMLYSFPAPALGCICRFGLPPPTLAFSPDGQYLVAGWPLGAGATPLRVYRVADRALVQTLDVGDTLALWTRSGDTLYASGSSGSVATWTPDGRLLYLADTSVWPYQAGLSPDGTKVAYTGYADVTNLANVRVYVFDIPTQTTRMLIDASRSQVTFVRDGWVWYFEEVTCDGCPGGTKASGKVFAMQLSSGSEIPVAFAAGEAPTDLSPGEFWPHS